MNSKYKNVSVLKSLFLSLVLIFAAAPISHAENPALNPTFSNTVSTSDGFTITIANFDAAFTWTIFPTFGTASRVGSSITISGLYPGQSSFVRVTTSRTGYASGMGTFVGSAQLGAALVPTFSADIPTKDGFTIKITNYDATRNWTVTTSAGAATRNAEQITVTGLYPGQSATITVTSSRSGFNSGKSTVSGNAGNGVALVPSFSSVTSTADGFTLKISNYDAAYTWSVTSTEGKVTRDGATVSVTGLTSGQGSSLTVKTSRSGYDSGSASISGSSIRQVVSTPAPIPTQNPVLPVVSPSPSSSQTRTPTPTPSPTATKSTTPTPSASSTISKSPTPTPTVPKISSSPSTSSSPSNSPSVSTPSVSSSANPVREFAIGERVVGKKLSPVLKGSTVLVPVAAADGIPAIPSTPTSINSIIKNVNTVVRSNVFDNKSVTPVKNVILGGIKGDQKVYLPYLNVNGATNKNIEIQVANGIPTSLSLINLRPNFTAKLTIVDSNKKQVIVGTFKVAKDGSLEIPPLTMTSNGKLIKIVVRVGSVSKTLTVRSVQ